MQQTQAPQTASEGDGNPLDMPAAEFRALGHHLVDRLADYLEGIAGRPAAPNLTPCQALRTTSTR